MTSQLDAVPKTVNGGSVHSAAFKLAITELDGLGLAVTETMREELVDAIMTLVRAGQREPEQLARYAVSRAKAKR